MARKPTGNPRGRPRKAPAAPPASGGPGHNIGELDDDQRQALTRRYAKQRKDLVNAEKAAKTARLNHDKIIKADLGATGLDDIKDLEVMESDPKYEEKIRAENERQMRVARWAGLEIGFQSSLLDAAPVTRPLRERALDEGKRAGMDGDPCVAPANYSPGTDGEQGWIEGWHRGQGLLAEKIKPTGTAESGLIHGEGNAGSAPDEFDKGGDEDWPDDAQAAANKAAQAAGDTTSTVQ